jgi:hypothetical protein
VGGTNITCGGARSSSYTVSQPTHLSQIKSATYRLRGDCTAPLAPCNDVGWEPPRLRVLRVSQIKSDMTPQPAAQNHASHGVPHACGNTKSEVQSRKYEGKPEVDPQPAAQNHALHGVTPRVWGRATQSIILAPHVVGADSSALGSIAARNPTRVGKSTTVKVGGKAVKFQTPRVWGRAGISDYRISVNCFRPHACGEESLPQGSPSPLIISDPTRVGKSVTWPAFRPHMVFQTPRVWGRVFVEGEREYD